VSTVEFVFGLLLVFGPITPRACVMLGGGRFNPRERAILKYARQLTRSPDEMRESVIEEVRAVGLDDGRILEVNQVVSYFAYMNRTVLGLGVTTKSDTLGLSPAVSANLEDWRHS
jgi:uncharacterized protein YciW